MQPATVTATIIDLGTVRLTRTRPVDPVRAAQVAAEEAEYQAQVKAHADAHDVALWAWLAERPAAHTEEYTGTSARKVTVIGKTAEAVQAEISRYTLAFPATVYLTRFNRVEPWHQGFRATGTRWSFS